MITPIHLLFDFGAFTLLNELGVVHGTGTDMILLFSAELIDLDHLFSRPIYSVGRNPFRTHFLHKKWPVILAVAILFLFYRPILFLGIGLLAHLFLDYIYTLIYRSK
jgi:hypothetical protein